MVIGEKTAIGYWFLQILYIFPIGEEMFAIMFSLHSIPQQYFFYKEGFFPFFEINHLADSYIFNIR